jgi:DNA polymerase
MPMYHPAAALHQGNLRKTIEDDFKKIPAVLAKARYEADHEATRPRPDAQPQLAAAGPVAVAQDPQATQLGLLLD